MCSRPRSECLAARHPLTRVAGVACNRVASLRCAGLPRGDGSMDRLSTYPRYPCDPSSPPLERAVSVTVCSCGDDANLCPRACSAPALCQAVPLCTAGAPLSARLANIVRAAMLGLASGARCPWCLHGPTRGVAPPPKPHTRRGAGCPSRPSLATVGLCPRRGASHCVRPVPGVKVAWCDARWSRGPAAVIAPAYGGGATLLLQAACIPLWVEGKPWRCPAGVCHRCRPEPRCTGTLVRVPAASSKTARR